jgi:hypothetical protein
MGTSSVRCTRSHNPERRWGRRPLTERRWPDPVAGLPGTEAGGTDRRPETGPVARTNMSSSVSEELTFEVGGR